MYLGELNWRQIASLAPRTPIVFPVAALEQHGHHLPVLTDTMLLGEIVRRAEARMSSGVVFAPVQWLGNSDHHLDFAGTLSAPPRAYLDLLGGLIENALRHGFRRVVFLNGHGGNDVPGRQAIFEARQRHRERADLLLLFATYWNLGTIPAGDRAGFSQSEMGHACEWETSMILRIAPQLVSDREGLDPVPAHDAFEPAARGWITKDRTVTGHIGDPRAATAAKGEILFNAFTDGVVQLLERVVVWDGRAWNA